MYSSDLIPESLNLLFLCLFNFLKIRNPKSAIRNRMPQILHFSTSILSWNTTKYINIRFSISPNLLGNGAKGRSAKVHGSFAFY
jgi:hypothetical protein